MKSVMVRNLEKVVIDAGYDLDVEMEKDIENFRNRFNSILYMFLVEEEISNKEFDLDIIRARRVFLDSIIMRSLKDEDDITLLSRYLSKHEFSSRDEMLDSAFMFLTYYNILNRYVGLLKIKDVSSDIKHEYVPRKLSLKQFLENFDKGIYNIKNKFSDYSRHIMKNIFFWYENGNGVSNDNVLRGIKTIRAFNKAFKIT